MWIDKSLIQTIQKSAPLRNTITVDSCFFSNQFLSSIIYKGIESLTVINGAKIKNHELLSP